MKFRNIAKAAASAVALSVLLCGCGDGKVEFKNPDNSKPTVSSVKPSSSAKPASSAKSSSAAEPVTVDPADSKRGTELSLTDTGLEINRIDKSAVSSQKDGIWTVLVYMCASDLESNHGCATADLNEMINATAYCGNLRFVVEADGVKEWQNDIFKSSDKNRLLIEKGQYNLLETEKSTNMGKPETLKNFLTWAVPEYSSQYMVLDFWDHGGGSVSGVCFDERCGYDSLSAEEIDTALKSVYDILPQKFEIIGFDACLMATVEMANILVPYANYMSASQENEPGNGWDYQCFAEAVKAGAKSGGDVAPYLRKYYFESCKQTGEQDMCTFSTVDLSKIDDFVKAFNDYSEEAYAYAENGNLNMVITAAKNSQSFGPNNYSEGFTNMVDAGDLLKNSSAFSSVKAQKALKALEACVVDIHNGRFRKNAGGLSVYYPICVQGTSELSDFTRIAPSPYYLALVDMCAYGCSTMGKIDDNNADSLVDGFSGYWQGSDSINESAYDYWQQGDSGPSISASETAIQFDTAPQINSDGYYSFKISPDSLIDVESIYCNVLECFYDEDDGKTYLLDMGTDFDVDMDWDTGVCSDNFNGTWFVLGDGQGLCVYLTDIIWDDNEHCALYTAPVLINDTGSKEEEDVMFLKIKQSFPISGSGEMKTEILGAAYGIGENGEASKYTYQLQSGDRIEPVYYAYDADTYEYQFYYYGEAYTYKGGGFDDIDMGELEDSDYLYGFQLTDYYGNTTYTDFVRFNYENGEVTYY